MTPRSGSAKSVPRPSATNVERGAERHAHVLRDAVEELDVVGEAEEAHHRDQQAADGERLGDARGGAAAARDAARARRRRGRSPTPCRAPCAWRRSCPARTCSTIMKAPPIMTAQPHTVAARRGRSHSAAPATTNARPVLSCMMKWPASARLSVRVVEHPRGEDERADGADDDAANARRQSGSARSVAACGPWEYCSSLLR